MTRRDAPVTEEGWYVLHDFRRIDWDAWRAAPDRERDRALAEGTEFLRARENLADADEGDSAVFSISGHEADILMVHLRPKTGHLDRIERAFEHTALAEFTERTDSYVSVTEISGYVTEELEDGIENIESDGTRNYMLQRLYPSIPDAEHVCFYPMDKRRDPEYNWYDLSFDERADLIAGHGEIGREYAGKVTQIISGSMGFDDHEWGVTLFAEDPTEIKHLLADMRFDPSSSRYAEFGRFRFGRRFAPEHLPDLLAGEALPAYGDADAEDNTAETTETTHESTDEETTEETDEDAHADSEDTDGTDSGSGRPDPGEPLHEAATTEELEEELRRLGIDASEHPEAGYGLIFYSDENAEAIVDEVDGLRSNFEHYDTHMLTSVRAHAGRTAVVSLWANERAANTAAGFLGDIAGVDGDGIGGPLADRDASDRTDTAAASDETAEPPEIEGTDEDDDIRGELSNLDIYAGKPHGEDVYAIVLYSAADLDDLREEVDSLSGGFDRYDTHVGTSLYEGTATDRAAVVSLWDTDDAAQTAGDYLSELPEIVGRAGEESGFGTMGMFYTVKPDYRDDFVDHFGTVGEMLTDMDGHIETDLMVNVEDENDMFIASQWEDRADAMAFFRSDAFRDTVEWGRDVLADRPRHVFLA